MQELLWQSTVANSMYSISAINCLIRASNIAIESNTEIVKRHPTLCIYHIHPIFRPIAHTATAEVTTIKHPAIQPRPRMSKRLAIIANRFAIVMLIAITSQAITVFLIGGMGVHLLKSATELLVGIFLHGDFSGRIHLNKIVNFAHRHDFQGQFLVKRDISWHTVLVIYLVTPTSIPTTPCP